MCMRMGGVASATMLEAQPSMLMAVKERKRTKSRRPSTSEGSMTPNEHGLSRKLELLNSHRPQKSQAKIPSEFEDNIVLHDLACGLETLCSRIMRGMLPSGIPPSRRRAHLRRRYRRPRPGSTLPASPPFVRAPDPSSHQTRRLADISLDHHGSADCPTRSLIGLLRVAGLALALCGLCADAGVTWNALTISGRCTSSSRDILMLALVGHLLATIDDAASAFQKFKLQYATRAGRDPDGGRHHSSSPCPHPEAWARVTPILRVRHGADLN